MTEPTPAPNSSNPLQTIKTAVITGGTSGIGLALAKLLSAEDIDITLAARNQARGERALKELKQLYPTAKVSFISCNVARLTDVQALKNHLTQKYTSLDLLVNAAAILKRTDLTDLGAIDEQLDVLLKGTMYVTGALFPLLKAGHGTVLNFSSIAGRHHFPGLTFYGTAKAALEYYTRALALEGAPYGIKALCLSPGVVRTNLVSEFEYEALEQKHPGSVVSPLDIARTIISLIQTPGALWNGTTVDLSGRLGLFPYGVTPAAQPDTDDRLEYTATIPPEASTSSLPTESDVSPPALKRAKEVVAEVFGVSADDLTADSSPEDIVKWDSIGHLRLIAQVENLLNRRLNVDEVMDLTTVAAVARLLEGAQTGGAA